MKYTKEQSARLQKWGLFIMLAGSTGFSLSMNPEHFNNIARNEGPVHHIELAQTAEAGKETATGTPAATTPVAQAAPAKPAPGEENKVLQRDKIYVIGNGSTCTVSMTLLDGLAIGKFSATQGQPCKFDNEIKKFSTTNLNDVASIIKEGQAMLAAETTTTTATGEKKVVQKAGEATEVDLAKWAEKCEKLTADDSKLNCHKTRLIELSKYLKNDSETSSLVYDYFRTHLASSIRDGLHRPTVREVSRDRCEGNVISWTQFNRVLCESNSALEESSEMVEEIISGLRAGNGKKVADALIKSRAGSFSSQLRHSQSLAARGFDEGDERKFQAGIRGMDYNSQMSLLGMANSSMMDSILGMQGTSSQKSLIERTLENSFYSPVAGMLNQMKQSLLTQNGGTTTNPLFTFQIPQLGGESMVAGGDSRIPGEPGNVPGLGNRSIRGRNINFGVAGAGFPGLQNRGTNPNVPYWMTLNPTLPINNTTTINNSRNSRN